MVLYWALVVGPGLRCEHRNSIYLSITVKPLLKGTSEMQPPPSTGHPCSAPFDIPHIDMYTVESSVIRTPPYAGQLTGVPKVPLLQRFYCTFKSLTFYKLCKQLGICKKSDLQMLVFQVTIRAHITYIASSVGRSTDENKFTNLRL